MSMVPAIKNWIIPLGTDWERILAFKQSIDGELVPIDLTGYSARMQIRNKRGIGASLLCDVNEEGEVEIADPESGEIRLAIPAAVTAAIMTAGLPIKTVAESTDQWGRQTKATGPVAVYDIELIAPSGDVQRPLQGDACLSLEVTVNE